jgi:hypothetical protein
MIDQASGDHGLAATRQIEIAARCIGRVLTALTASRPAGATIA